MAVTIARVNSAKMAWNTDETGFIVLLDKNRTQVISLKYENVFKISNYYIQETNNYKLGLSDEDAYQRIKLLMNELNITENYLDVIAPALLKSEKKLNFLKIKNS